MVGRRGFPIPINSIENRVSAARHFNRFISRKIGMSTELFFLMLPKPGDLGWVIHHHGVIYLQEYGWDKIFEALVTQSIADFVTHFNPERECCWIAEMGCDIVGSVFVVHKDHAIVRLHLLLIEPWPRGVGLGTLLDEECISLASI